METSFFGKMLVLFGVAIIGVGLLLMFYDKLPLLGKLPGDIHVKRENFQFFLPITTSLLISVLLTVVIWLIAFIGKK